MNSNWQVKDARLRREFEFTDFNHALKFVNKIVPLANDMNHHPDIFIHSYNKVTILLYTHSKNAITDQDYELAQKIDAL